MDEEYYEPDPHASWYHKVNPCHCDHVYALDWAQRLFEMFAPHCQCCSGVRVLLLVMAGVFALTDTVLRYVAIAIFSIVALAIVYDNVTRIIAAKRLRSMYDNGDEGSA